MENDNQGTPREDQDEGDESSRGLERRRDWNEIEGGQGGESALGDEGQGDLNPNEGGGDPGVDAIQEAQDRQPDAFGQGDD
jgi:hypothetical protein